MRISLSLSQGMVSNASKEDKNHQIKDEETQCRVFGYIAAPYLNQDNDRKSQCHHRNPPAMMVAKST